MLLAASLAVGLPGASAQVPGVTQSDNVEYITTFPESQAISGEFARTGPYFYISSLDSISAFDVSDPEDPQLLDMFPTVNFENEAMTYGERVVDGKLRRFLILAEDLQQVSPTDPDHIHVGGQRAHIVDVTNAADGPGSIFLAGQVDTEHSTHTVQCVDQANCQYAYNAGDNGEFEILDLTDLDNPKVLKKVKSPAAGPGGAFGSGGAGHYWDFDELAKVGWHTGSGGAVAFDVSDPTNPVPIQATNAKGVETPYNDFILHNSQRPNATQFEPGKEPSLALGNVLLVTEEDYVFQGNEILCEQQNGDEAGTFQTWHIPNMNEPAARIMAEPSNGTIRPLDIVNAPGEFGDKALLSTDVGVFCSAHWFDFHETGIVAQGYYQQGLWLEDVRDPENIEYYGHWTPVASEVWDAYWVPKRDKNGCPTGEQHNIVYSVDLIRGVDVLRVELPEDAVTATEPLPCFVPAANNPDPDPTDPAPDPIDEGPGDDVGDDEETRTDTGPTLPATGGGIGLLLLGAAALPAAAYLGRRRR